MQQLNVTIPSFQNQTQGLLANANGRIKMEPLESTQVNEDSIFPVKPAVERLRNYSSQQAKCALKTFSDCYSQLCNVDTDSDFDAESDFENTNVPVDMDTDTDGATNFNTFEVGQSRISQRSVLKPLYDQLLSAYESKDADHPGMPSIDRVINAMQDTIHHVNDFFMKLRNRPGSDKQSDKEYISVCRQQEKSRKRQFVASNGLR